MKKTTTRVAIYCRVSTEDQHATNQFVQLKEFVNNQNWVHAGEYIDHGFSGSRPGTVRPAFRDMMEAASRRSFDILLFWSLDRLSREGVSATLDYLNRLSSWGVGFRSYSEPYLDSCGIFKDAVLAILATIAKQERIRISDRTRAGLFRARLKGVTLGRPIVSAEISEQILRQRSLGKSIRVTAKICQVTPSMVFRVENRSKPRT